MGWTLFSPNWMSECQEHHHQCLPYSACVLIVFISILLFLCSTNAGIRKFWTVNLAIGPNKFQQLTHQCALWLTHRKIIVGIVYVAVAPMSQHSYAKWKVCNKFNCCNLYGQFIWESLYMSCCYSYIYLSVAPEWATDCLIRALPSLTIQYIADSATIELARDCGAGVSSD